MKRLLLFISFIFFTGIASFANHIKGGFFSYQYLGTNPSDPTKLRYSIKLTVYMLCNPNAGQLTSPINFSIFDGQTNQFIRNESVVITAQYKLNKSYDDPCITGDQSGCYYEIVEYNLSLVELPVNAGGYTIAYQRCCRIGGIVNLTVPSNSIGNTFSTTIPGNTILAGAYVNSSPRFLINDTAVVCGGSYFQYSFSASDENSDSLSYEFCEALQGASQSDAAPTTASSPPYGTVSYSFPYNGSTPLGSAVTIDSKTGLISGIAPATGGEYVIGVCVNEYRNGVWIGRTRKELHVRVGDCNAVRATLILPTAFCDGFTVNFNNATNNSLITSYFWDFGVVPQTNDTSNIASPTFIFPDTGVYTIKLVVNRNQSCTDSTTGIARVFPGFFPDFTYAGICVTKPTNFTDRSATTYGVVDSWRWDFADANSTADTSRIRNPTWTYSTTGPKNVVLTVTSNKGCSDTAIRTVDIIDKPAITLPFRDTLICVPDNLQLQAIGSGIFSWTPGISIINANTATPTVNPVTTTTYHVNLNDNGCINDDSVRVRVIRTVTLISMNDTTICQTDPIILRANTDALQYTWSPSGSLSNPDVANPIATPLTTTTYTLVGRVGSCTSSDDVEIKVVPYPAADAGPDQLICYQTTTQLNGITDASFFSWSPGLTLSSTTILNPFAFPKRTSSYFLTARDTLGCPKPVTDTVTITMLPRMSPFAGRDTAVVIGESLQFEGSGGISYLWTPPIGLNNPNIANPIGNYGADLDSVRYTLYVRNEADCIDSANVLVKIFKTIPSVFVPSAFTPNGDGLNDLIAPIAVGIKRIEYFRIYNRWGQMVFSTTMNGKGWDGKISGIPQSTNTYVWICSAVDYLDKRMLLKGHVTLIR
jgi:gliding motility-associated-like protein